VIAYPAILDVPRELVCELAKLLRDERRARGTRKGTRLLTCFRQALLVLVWFRTRNDVAVVGAGFKVSRATWVPQLFGCESARMWVLSWANGCWPGDTSCH
jgi:hypothetical protein